MENKEKKQKTETKEQNAEKEKKENKADEIVELKAQLKKEKETAEEYKDKWIRNVAEFDNYKKRNAKVYSDAFNEGKSEVILKILSIGDNLDSALSFELDEKTKEGVKLIKKKFDETLKSLEVEEINPLNEKFDPMVAEAVMQVEGDGESEIVKQVLIKGYKLKDKIIRYAKVSVTK